MNILYKYKMCKILFKIVRIGLWVQMAGTELQDVKANYNTFI